MTEETTTTGDNDNHQTMKVAILGGGPAGMFVCHWIDSLLAESSSSNPSSKKNLSVTCFEKSSRMGGIWRERDNGKAEEMGMYDNLWTNGFCQSFEFPDYTFDEHFGKPVTVYMHRKDVLGYMIARVTKKRPDFFEKFFQFNTEIKNVTYDEDSKKFSVVMLDLTTNTEKTELFDKCVWACGDSGKPSVPASLKALFQDGGFQGKLMHSGEIENLEEDVKGKRVLLIGGNASGEDVALQSVKCGAERVYISSRSPVNYVNDLEHWPGDKVEVLRTQMVAGVQGTTVEFGKTKMEFPEKFSLAKEGEISTTIENIDVVIFCTGYDRNVGNIKDCLPLPVHKAPYDVFPLQLPEGHKVPPTEMDHVLGHVEPGDKPGDVIYDEKTMNPGLYNGVSISNPNMMAVACYDTYWPLFTIDLTANFLAGCIVGTVTLPSADEMRKRVHDQAVKLHGSGAFFRFYLDRNFFNAVVASEGFWDGESEAWDECYEESLTATLSFLAGIAEEGNYPLSLGTPDKLSDAALAIHKMNYLCSCHRYQTEGWLTFRDCNDSHNFRSIHTGTVAVPLEKKWMDM